MTDNTGSCENTPGRSLMPGLCAAALLFVANLGLAGPARPVRKHLPRGSVGPVTATVDIDPTRATPLVPGFAGFNLAGVWRGFSYLDPAMQGLAATLAPGWLRYPAGTGSDAFDWTTGLTRQDWVDHFSSDSATQSQLAGTIPILGGKGGARFDDFVAMTRALGARIVICINAFTDTPESAGAFARYAREHGIEVRAWELANEPYLFPGFFANATDYANKMRPYRDAIKAADPNAVVAIFFRGYRSANWDDHLAAYPNAYWDAVAYHDYPATNDAVTFADLMAVANGHLANNTSAFVTGELIPKNRAGTAFLFSEIGPGLNNAMVGSLYGAVYVAEYELRLSSVPQVIAVGSSQLWDTGAILARNNHDPEVIEAYNQGRVLDTTGLDWGFFVSAQGLGAGVAHGALANASEVLVTTTAGGSNVATAGGPAIPALFTQAYRGATGRRYLVVTNKGGGTEALLIREAGAPVGGSLRVTEVSGPDPQARNTKADPYHVFPVSGTATNPVTIPPYAVVRIEW